jgi:hypothetical protein
MEYLNSIVSRSIGIEHVSMGHNGFRFRWCRPVSILGVGAVNKSGFLNQAAIEAFWRIVIRF